MVSLNPLRIFTRHRKPRPHREGKVPAALMQTNPLYSLIKPCIVESNEIILDPDIKKDKKKFARSNVIYTGYPPQFLEIDRRILPIPPIIRFLLRNKPIRVQLYRQIENEPVTRDVYNGKIIDPDKKKKVLQERGVIDEEGYLLDMEGNRLEREKGVIVKVDFSDVDFVRAEFHALEVSKAVEHASKAMAKTGAPSKLDEMKWVLIAAFVALVAVVFIMSGGFASLNL